MAFATASRNMLIPSIEVCSIVNIELCSMLRTKQSTTQHAHAIVKSRCYERNLYATNESCMLRSKPQEMHKLAAALNV
jgi:hypothetical protein